MVLAVYGLLGFSHFVLIWAGPQPPPLVRVNQLPASTVATLKGIQRHRVPHGLRLCMDWLQ